MEILSVLFGSSFFIQPEKRSKNEAEKEGNEPLTTFKEIVENIGLRDIWTRREEWEKNGHIWT